jgi:Mrp family chromosome partitioning ATPase
MYDIEKTLEMDASIRNSIEESSRVAIRIEKSSESFTYLHTAVEYAAEGVGRSGLSEASLFQGIRPVVLGITSSIPGEGKTTVALHLAMDIARNNFKKVCLMDMSLGDDTLSRRLDIKSGAGIVDVLEGSNHTIPIIDAMDCEGLSIMPAGKTPINAARAARSPSVPEILAAAREMYDVIVIDMPSVASGNVLPIAPHLDAVIMVVYAGVTPKDLVASALKRLGQARVLGIVLNRMTSSTPSWLQRRLNRW